MEKLKQHYRLENFISLSLSLSRGSNFFIFEGDSIIIVMAMNKLNLISDWIIALVIRDVQCTLAAFQNWRGSKIHRQSNMMQNGLPTSRGVFGNISCDSPFFSGYNLS
jgi:hypothetical protein